MLGQAKPGLKTTVQQQAKETERSCNVAPT